MNENKYTVLIDTCVVLATGMTLDDALLFMKAYCEKYYLDYISLTLRRDNAGQEGAEDETD